MDRLIKTSGLYESKTYEYDKRGNLIGISDRGKKIKAYEYEVSGRLSLSYSCLGKARSYAYDGLGNRVGFKEYGIESKGFVENELKRISELNLSERKPVYEERYVLDRTKPYNNVLQRSITEIGKEKVQSYAWDFNTVFMDEEDKAYTYMSDELGSTIRLLEEEGDKQTIYGYDEFGNDTYKTQGEVQPFGYTGYRYDMVADTYFAQAREYAPRVGRFGGEDWIKGSIDQPFSLNSYNYCGNNSLIYIDLSGKERLLVSGGVYSAEKQKKGKYYYEFIDPAIAQINEWQKEGATDITWLVSNAGWTNADINAIQRVASSENVNLYFINNKSDLINYINNKTTPKELPRVAAPGNATRANDIKHTRNEDLITEFSVFSHGFVKDGGTVSLGYNYEDEDYNKSLNLTINDIASINSGAFNTPQTNFYSCNTGTAGKDSFAQYWVNRVCGLTYAFNGKTSYKNVADTSLQKKISRGLAVDIFGGNTKFPEGSEGVERILFMTNCSE